MEKIKEIKYERENIFVVNGVECMKNIVIFEDGSTAIRNGILSIKGDTIKEMSANLKAATNKIGWWSLQATSLKELKAAYRAGFRATTGIMELSEHIEAFKKSGTLHVQKLVVGGNYYEC